MEKEKYIWLDGQFCEWDNAKIHVLTHSLHYGLAAFEGIRSYKHESGKPSIFRLKDHIKRLFDSCKIAQIESPYSHNEIIEVCREVVRRNKMMDAYIRPLVCIGYGEMGVYPGKNPPVTISVSAWKWGKYLGPQALEKGIRAKISSYTRYHPNTMMTHGKITGNYATSVLAKKEAKELGYDEAILLDPDGFVAEGSGENIFIVEEDKIKTTPLTCILPGITRKTVFEIARNLGYEIIEQRFTRDELYIADEVFFSGTAAEITPIREIDGRPINNSQPGNVTRRIQKLFFDIVCGVAKEYSEWLDVLD